MPPNGTTVCHDGISPSLRLSCDRCRAHKLKCSGPAGANNTCQRCKRAEAPCVFGRRAPSKRRLSKTSSAEQGSTTVPVPGTVTPASLATPPPASSSAFATGATALSSCAGLALGGQLEAAAMDADLALPPVPEMDGNPFEAPAAWESLTTGYMSECGSDIVGYDWAQPGWAPNQPAMFDVCQPDMTPWPQMATPTPPDMMNQPADVMDLVGSTAPSTAPSTTGSTTGSTASSSEIPPSQRLTSIVSDIQQQLRRLEEGPWHTDSACSLDDYPVGTILELVQQFGALAGPILSRVACRGGPLDDGAAIMTDHEPGDYGGSRDGIGSANEDTPSMLLVMCGYMWLVRIYGVVLSHFQKHLHHRQSAHHRHDHFDNNNTHHHHRHHRPDTTATNPFDINTTTATTTPNTPTPTPTPFSTPSSVPPTTRPTAATITTTLRLSELPCASAEALHLQQIHTAVRLLLDALHDVEAHLGRGATVARAMAVALLLRSGDGAGGAALHTHVHDWESGSGNKGGGGGGGSSKNGGAGRGAGRCHGVDAKVGVAADGWDGLDRKASAVRELLRERMGL